MTYTPESLYELLPAIERIRDAEQGYPLRSLLAVLAEQAEVLEQDIQGLYENWFIETCAAWLVPYIGDLVGNRPIYPVRQTARADVAKTIYYRRRKGTLAMLEELARDVTGWGAHAVEFFELLSWTQHVNHLRFSPSPSEGSKPPCSSNPQLPRRNPLAYRRVGSVNLRDSDALDRLNGPFDDLAHSVDVRRIGPEQGWYNLKNIGFFLWRLQAYPLEKLTPKRASKTSHGFFFNPLGLDTALFTDTVAETDDAGLAGEIHVPGPIRPRALLEDLEHYHRAYESIPAAEWPKGSTYYGPEASFTVYKNGDAIAAADLCCMNLEAWPKPPAGKLGVDVRLGRLSVPEREKTANWQVSYAYGFSGELGGGPYRRQSALREDWEQWVQTTPPWRRVITKVAELQRAIDEWNAMPSKTLGIITLENSLTYLINFTVANAVSIPQGSRLLIEAKHETRPHLLGDISVRGEGGGELALEGLLLEGKLTVLSGDLGRLRLAHCTLVPDKASPVVNVKASSVKPENQNANLELDLERCISGTLVLPNTVPKVFLKDCIVDAVEGPYQAVQAVGSLLCIKGSTLLGSLVAKRLEAENSLFMGTVTVKQHQEGCVRFCYVPESSHTPKRYRCQPDLALQRAKDAKGGDLGLDEQARVHGRVRPAFTSLHFGDPGFAQLRFDIAQEIYTGAENGAEMGAFNFLLQPQREANLRTRLEEYLPVGLEAGLIFVN
jgi:hypothetical protein